MVIPQARHRVCPAPSHGQSSDWRRTATALPARIPLYVTAILASTAVPGLFPPIRVGDNVSFEYEGVRRHGRVNRITKRATIKGAVDVSPDASGYAVFVTFDGVIGIQTVPAAEIEKVAS